MRTLLRSEFDKLVSVRTAAGLTLGAVVVAGLGTFSTIASSNPEGLDRPLHDQMFFLLASINLGLFALVLGTRAFTDEFRYGSIVPTLLVAPARGRVLAAKVITYAAAGAVLVAAALAVTLAIAYPMMGTKGAALTVRAADGAALAGMVAAGALWGVIGVAVGALVRQQVAAVVGALIWVLVVENLGAGLLRDAGRYLPGQAAHALADASQAGTLLAPALGAAVLAAYALVALALAALRMVRTDIVTT